VYLLPEDTTRQQPGNGPSVIESRIMDVDDRSVDVCRMFDESG